VITGVSINSICLVKGDRKVPLEGDISGRYIAFTAKELPELSTSNLTLSFHAEGFGYKKAEQPIARFLTLIVIGTVIVVANLEHGMFDMFMYSLYKPFDGGLTVKVVYMIMANCLGTIIVPLLNKLRSKIKSI